MSCILCFFGFLSFTLWFPLFIQRLSRAEIIQFDFSIFYIYWLQGNETVTFVLNMCHLKIYFETMPWFLKTHRCGSQMFIFFSKVFQISEYAYLQYKCSTIDISKWEKQFFWEDHEPFHSQKTPRTKLCIFSQHLELRRIGTSTSYFP